MTNDFADVSPKGLGAAKAPWLAGGIFFLGLGLVACSDGGPAGDHNGTNDEVSEQECPTDLFAAENAACGQEGMVCGEETCTDPCQFCNTLFCERGVWVRREAFPSPSCRSLEAGQCREDADCEVDTTSCTPPGVGNCGVCFGAYIPCSADADCAGSEADLVCNVDSLIGLCPCWEPGECVPRCTQSSDCAPGQSCDGTGHCVDDVCASATGSCATQFDCDSETTRCRRRECNTDLECDAPGYCVQLKCYDSPGSCEPPAP